ncbi:hypothetical protein COP1_014217 [Malus domestica]
MNPVNFDLTRDVIHPSKPENTREAAERTKLLNRILTSRGLRREQNPVVLADDVVDLTQSNVTGVETRENRQLQSLLLKRTQSHRATQSSLSSALSSAERLVEAFYRNHNRNQEQQQPAPVGDRDSFSSIAAVINSESQLDTGVEICSMVYLSTSSSRRRNDLSRVSDMDSGDSRAHRRRRRLN